MWPQKKEYTVFPTMTTRSLLQGQDEMTSGSRHEPLGLVVRVNGGH